ncbi:MAG: bifunctional (p)ppGpp synthetase/guanosine-3',5'-bis(diphosphate) 3'-pyrophosphohydrolase [Lentimicrobiaceae bacterium]|nr:bifunctional (p)ppGpp synthetase/guanosine-3',5'-bis(diphosphate) 3'-pyrophosphohydrolase [Lentimicrobiaceae bacterium]MCB9023292.1 bifunctional (p)ppGpp synthetase/guanosine-3',5'-bis(diphosphate) 3'-pyrophosphohydrolase [Lentimicrobiaceae bacterium]
MNTPLAHIDKQKIVVLKYRQLLQACKPFLTPSGQKQLRKAFIATLNIHGDHLYQTSESYFCHSVDVAIIVAKEMGLGLSSVIAAMLHNISHDDNKFAELVSELKLPEVAVICSNLNRLNQLPTEKLTDNAENFSSLLLSLADDVRSVLIQLADRLHHMRKIESLPDAKKREIALQTSDLYAPLAHKLGLYRVKGELDELSLHYNNPIAYQTISANIAKAISDSSDFIIEFLDPIKAELSRMGLDFVIKNRTKSVSSVFTKMKKQQVDFEEVFDLFAIRIILNSSISDEKADCWKAYSVVTNLYKPEPKRLRDWITIPRPNGYESLHVTVLGPGKRWVEVQIRTLRMDEEAESGNAAHWRYKGQKGSVETDEWLNSIRKILENPEESEEALSSGTKPVAAENTIYVFTPEGDLKKLRAGSTVLDFAFEVHTNLGAKCSGGRVNKKIVPIRHLLKNGDQVEIITSRNQNPNIDWLGWVTTSRAKTKIKRYLKEAEFKQAEAGKDIFRRKIAQLKITKEDEAINKLVAFFKLSGPLDLFQKLAESKIEPSAIKDIVIGTTKAEDEKIESKPKPPVKAEPLKTNRTSENVIIVNENSEIEGYKLARCCNPVMGDEIFGFITVSDGIKIHRISCPNASRMRTRFPYRSMDAQWSKPVEGTYFISTVKISGFDQLGILSSITNLISNELKMDVRTISLDSKNGKFDGLIKVSIRDTKHLDLLMKRLLSIKGIIKATRQSSSN